MRELALVGDLLSLSALFVVISKVKHKVKQ